MRGFVKKLDQSIMATKDQLMGASKPAFDDVTSSLLVPRRVEHVQGKTHFLKHKKERKDFSSCSTHIPNERCIVLIDKTSF